MLDEYLKKWRNCAKYDINEKHKRRFDLLRDLQVLFQDCNFELMNDLIEGLSRQVHGAEYTYRKLKQNCTFKLTDKIQVYCPKHGKFSVRLIDHLLPLVSTGYAIGCLKCNVELRKGKGSNKRLNTTMFISKAELKHGDKYDYSLSKYISSSTKLKIRCYECNSLGYNDVFEQKPNNHLNGAICRKCFERNNGIRARDTFESAVAKAKLKHGDKYEYLDFYKVENKDKPYIRYRCKQCDIIIEQTLNVHLLGSGCSVCGRKRTALLNGVTFEDAIIRAIKVHGYVNHYHRLHESKGDGQLIEYTCIKCGHLNIQRMSSHINRGSGCSECAKTSRRMSFEHAIKKCIEKHGDKYEYLELLPPNEKHVGQRIHYKCKTCGEDITQRLNNHLLGKGCSVCNNRGGDFSNVQHPMRLYFVRFDQYDQYDENNIVNSVYKIGCTRYTINRRFRKTTSSILKINVLYEKIFEPGHLAFEMEQEIITKFQQYRYRGESIMKEGGNTELFTEEGCKPILEFITSAAFNLGNKSDLK